MPVTDMVLGAVAVLCAVVAAVLGYRARSRRDADEAAKAELSRRIDAERARLDDLIAQVPVALALWEGPEHRCAAFSPPYGAVMAGRARVGEPFAALFPELAATRAALCDVFRTGTTIDIPARAVQVEGSDREVSERYLAT